MQEDFHYYATYCAAHIAGHDTDACSEIAYCAQLPDLFTRTFINRIGGPASAATTQLQLELVDARTDMVGLQDVTRIWASFHFLPRDLHADPGRGGRRYRNKFRLICGPNGPLVKDTVELARDRGPQATGLAMHVLADTWAHQRFAGTPSLVINNTNGGFTELVPGNGGELSERKIAFSHNPTAQDDLEHGRYVSSVYQQSENSIMNLGHGRAGHLPDYSFARYRYLPAWGNYEEVLKDNPSDYWHAFCQMVHAMRCLRTGEPFETECYDEASVGPWVKDVKEILERRQLDSCSDWRDLGERMTGVALRPFDLEEHVSEYVDTPASERDSTFLGRFALAALAQKSMVTNRIYSSGNPLAGVSLDYESNGLRGMRDFFRLANRSSGGEGR